MRSDGPLMVSEIALITGVIALDLWAIILIRRAIRSGNLKGTKLDCNRRSNPLKFRFAIAWIAFSMAIVTAAVAGLSIHLFLNS